MPSVLCKRQVEVMLKLESLWFYCTLYYRSEVRRSPQELGRTKPMLFRETKAFVSKIKFFLAIYGSFVSNNFWVFLAIKVHVFETKSS